MKSLLRFPPLFALVLIAALLSSALPGRPGSVTDTSRASVNPVIDRNFPDPSVLEAGGVYYAYATNTRLDAPMPHVNLRCARSTDLVHWTPLPDAMPRLPL